MQEIYNSTEIYSSLQVWYCFSHILIKIKVKLQLLIKFLIIVFICKIVTKSKCTRKTASFSRFRIRYQCKTHSTSPVIWTSSSTFTQCSTLTHWYRSRLGTHWSHCCHVPMASVSLLNFQSCRHIGHSWLTCWEFSHLTIQWMWKQCEHSPQTEKDVQHEDLRTYNTSECPCSRKGGIQ